MKTVVLFHILCGNLDILPFKSYRGKREMNAFIQQGCIKFIKHDTKDILLHNILSQIHLLNKES